MTSRNELAEISVLAAQVAKKPLPDDQLLRELRVHFASVDRRTLALAAKRANVRDGFLEDRTYRLLRALAEDSSVAPIARKVRETFLSQERLGRLPLDQAFSELCVLEPRLREVEAQVQNGKWSRTGGPEHQVLRYVRKAVEGLVGLNAERRDPLLTSSMAMSVAVQFLIQTGRNFDYGRGNDAILDRRSPFWSYQWSWLHHRPTGSDDDT